MKKSVKKQLLMNKTGDEIQVALVEEGRLVELIIERPESRRSIGDIYLGRVHKVIEGLKAAFVDIGQKSDGFLHFSDVGTTTEDYRALIEDDDDENGESDDEGEANGSVAVQAETSGAKTVARSGGRGPSAAGKDRSEQAEKRQSYTQMIAGKLKANDSILYRSSKSPSAPRVHGSPPILPLPAVLWYCFPSVADR